MLQCFKRVLTEMHHYLECRSNRSESSDFQRESLSSARSPQGMHLVSQRVVHFAQKLGSQPLEDDFRWDAVDEELVQLSSNLIQYLGRLLLQAIAHNFLQCI